jgi:PPOX class probable F420-dependent enzyme
VASIPASHRDLLEAQVGTLATVGNDGRPQLSEVWFLVDGDAGETVRISLNSSRQKVRNLQRRPACSFLIVDLANPYRYLEIRGDAELERDDDYVFADRVGAKYQSDLREHDRPGEYRVIVTIQPVRVNAVDMSG